MGNTCSSVHIALTGTTPDAIEGIVRAYTTLGFERVKTASPEGGKHVILLRKEGDAFLSVYDSDNAALDTGELKDLALATSKIVRIERVVNEHGFIESSDNTVLPREERKFSFSVKAAGAVSAKFVVRYYLWDPKTSVAKASGLSLDDLMTVIVEQVVKL